MKNKDNRPSEADPQVTEDSQLGTGGSPEEVEQNSTPAGGASQEEGFNVLEEAKKVTNRDFKDNEDFLKYLQNVNSLAGDQKIAELRKKAEEYDKMNSEETGNSQPEATTAVDELKQKIETMEDREYFFKKFPEATQDDFLVAQDRKIRLGVEFKTAVDQVSGYVEAAIERRNSKEGEGIESKERISPDQSQNPDKKFQEAQNSGDWSKLVRERMGMGE